MKRFITLSKKLVPAVLFLTFGVISTQAQMTTLIDPAGDGGFENGTTLGANNWLTPSNTAPANKFWVGAVAGPSAGARSAYVSDDAAGATYNYITTTASTFLFYRDISFPAGQTDIRLTFKWKGQGEGSYDYVTVFSMPTTNVPLHDSPAGAFQSWLQIPTVYPGAVIHCSPPNLNLQSAYQTQTICLPSSYAGTTRRLVFMWSNDSSVGTQPPASVDEISLVSQVPPSPPTSQPTALSFTPPPTISTISGSFTGTTPASTGYLVVRTTTATPPSAPVDNTTYTVGQSALGGVIVSTSASTTFTSAGLAPNTPYFFWIYSYNGACAGPFYNAVSPLTGSASTTDCSLSGVKTVGPTGDYATLTAAVAAASSQGLAASVVFELQPTYVSSSEPAFPIVIPELLCAGPSRTLTIRPQAGATALSITSANATGTIQMNGGDYVIFDGRPGGTGTASELTISNSSTTGYAIQYINGATNNIVRYSTVSGVNTSTTNGVVAFSTTTTGAGNSNNLFEFSTFTAGATTPVNLVYSLGTTTGGFAAQNNNITFSNNNFRDWFSATLTNYAINVAGASSDWTISNNSFY
ncbi:MAG: hypothetical protein ACKOCH_25880, partial [Bacteroidota bacterium]